MSDQTQKPFYKRWWFILIVAIFIFGGIGSIFEDDEEVQENEEPDSEKVEEDITEENLTKDIDLDIEIEITETKIEDENVTVKGTTNLIDGAFLSYQLRATEDNVKIENGEWEVIRTIEELEKDDENNIYGDGTEYNFFITFPSFGSTEEQSEEIVEAYGGTGATKITGGPNFYESEDGTLKTVSLSIDFDKDGIIDEDERKTREFEQAVEDWNDHFKSDMLDHYSEVGIIAIEMNPGSNWDVVNVYVPNEFKLSSEEEKTYYVEEVGPLLEQDLTSHFKKDHDVHVYFLYEDGNTMASRKMFGGWKIK